jgi:hypothetical protein
MKKVWVVKEQVIRGDAGPIVMDYTPAMEYGDLEFITMHDMPLYGKSSVQDMWNQDASHFALKYDDQNDFIVTTGQPTAIFTVGWVLGLVRKTPRFLVWRREEGKYRPLHVDSTAFTPLIGA